MIDTTKPLWQASACDIAEAVGAGQLSCADAVGAAVDRMRDVNGDLNAVVDDMGDAALAEAEAADKALAGGAAPGPLQGVPVTIKVNIDQTGRATTNGVTAFKDVIAPADAPVVNNLRNAGAIVIGRTNTPEFSFRATTSNEVHGRTKSPWNDWVTSGGSSGGASSAVMAGMGAIAHGNDIGGSLRFPAWATGAATVKPGLGRVPAYNPSAPAERGVLAQLMSVQGAICRNVGDVRLAMQALIEPDPHDPWQAPVPWSGAPQSKKVAFTKEMFEFDLTPQVSAALDKAASALSDAGYEVVEIDPPELRETAREANRCLFGETIGLLGKDIENYGSETIRGIFAEYAKMFTPYEGLDLQLAMARRSAFIRKWVLFLQEYPLILTPFMPTLPFKWDRDTEGEQGVREVLGAAIWSYSMNFLGLPAGNVAADFADGLPVGVQIVGQRFREDMILDACEAVEARAGMMAERLWASMG
ncbi:MAG: amidase family protein [Pseudomonadota bacterium]